MGIELNRKEVGVASFVVSAKGKKGRENARLYTERRKRERGDRVDEEIYRSSSHSSSTCFIVGSSEDDRRELPSDVIDSRLKELAAW